MPRSRLARSTLLFAAFVLGIGRAAPARASWASDGNVVVGPASAPASPVVVPCPGGGAYLAWVDARSGFDTDIRATLWTASGVPASGWRGDGDLVTNITCSKLDLSGAPDGSGGALLAWSDNRCVGYGQIYVARVGAPGVSSAGWPANGVHLAPTGADQLAPAVASDSAGGAFVAWQDLRGAEADVYLQHVDGTGAIVAGWPAAGLALAAVAGVQSVPVLAADGAGGVFVAWQDRRSGDDDIYLQHVTGAGALVAGWPANGLAACAAAGDQRAPCMVPDDAGGVVVAWQDHRAGSWDVYALRVASGGGPASGWSAGGTPVCQAAGDQTAVRLARDGAHGVELAWQDGRGADLDIYASHLTANASVAAGWLASGTPVAVATADQSAPDVAADGAGGIYLAWQDRQDGSADIRAAHLAGDGTTVAGWTAGGSLLCGAAGDQTAPRVASAGGDAYVLWPDLRDGGPAPELYAQRVLPGGPIQVRPTSLTALHHDGQTFLTWVCPPDTGWTHRVYFRSTPIATDADLASATLLGSVGDSAATDRRLSARLGARWTFRVDSAAAPLAPDRGLFVVTVTANRAGCYAVTSQLRGAPEDRHVVPGGNALVSAVPEVVGLPRPVYEGYLAQATFASDFYTLWTWPESTPLCPAMSNHASWPYDCGVTLGTVGAPGFVRPHQRAGNFVDAMAPPSGGAPWVLALDDYTLNGDVGTYWYGYHPGYDFTSDANSPPTTGVVSDYTNRRCLYTIGWWRRTFPFDTTSCYAFGYSLGGTYSMHLALEHPELVVAAMSAIGKVDFAFEADPDPGSMFNSGTPFRDALSRLWGTTSTNLWCSEGLPVYAEMNDDSLIARTGSRTAAFLVNSAGRHDNVVGWAEKRGFYAALETYRLGGVQFWDNRDHYGAAYPGAFSPMDDPGYLYRFRSNRSWPAFSRCSANSDPGDFTATTGDSIGTLNGYLDWDPAVTEKTTFWQVTLRTRPLTTLWGTLAAPESLTADVTPRRVQHFEPGAFTPVTWSAVRVSDGARVQGGVVSVDASGLVTAPAVRVYRAGTILRLDGEAPGLSAPPLPHGAALALGPLVNPVRGRIALTVAWPREGLARVRLFDTGGRVARTLWDGGVPAGEQRLPGDLAGLAPGVYLLRAEQAGASVSRRVVVLR